jgi:hypothetical protein
MSARVSGNAVASPFARIASLAMGAKKKAEEDEDMKKDGEECAEDEDKKDDDKADKGGDEDDAKAAEDDEDDKKKDDEKAAEDDEDDDKKDKANKKARRAERARIASIVTSPAAQLSEAHFAQAAYLAFETDLDSKACIGMLQCMPAPAAQTKSSGRQAAQERIDQTPNPRVSDDAKEGGPDLAAQIVAAGKKRRGEA